jgi:hypothetical protein
MVDQSGFKTIGGDQSSPSVNHVDMRGPPGMFHRIIQRPRASGIEKCSAAGFSSRTSVSSSLNSEWSTTHPHPAHQPRGLATRYRARHQRSVTT